MKIEGKSKERARVDAINCSLEEAVGHVLFFLSLTQGLVLRKRR